MVESVSSNTTQVATQTQSAGGSSQPEVPVDTSAQPPAQITPSKQYVPETGYNPLTVSFHQTNKSDQADVTGWADSLRGQQSRPEDVELMQIANAVYDPNNDQAGKWTRVDDAQLSEAGLKPEDFETPSTGFRSGLFTDGQGHYVLGFSGSNGNKEDWLGNNIPQAFGADAEQYDQAVVLAQQVQNSKFGEGGNLMLTGHSLGGGLTGIASIVTGLPAVSFNGSGVHDKTIREHGLDPAQVRDAADDGQIRRYTVSGDPLTALQQDIAKGLPDAVGHEIVLAPPYERPKFDILHPIQSAKAQVDYVKNLHAQQTVIDALNQQRPWEAS